MKKPTCPTCKSKGKVVLAVYTNGDKFWECENCWQVIKEIKKKEE